MYCSCTDGGASMVVRFLCLLLYISYHMDIFFLQIICSCNAWVDWNIIKRVNAWWVNGLAMIQNVQNDLLCTVYLPNLCINVLGWWHFNAMNFLGHSGIISSRSLPTCATSLYVWDQCRGCCLGRRMSVLLVNIIKALINASRIS